MPLLKKAPQAVTPPVEATDQAATPKSEATAQTTIPPKRLGGTRKAGDKPAPHLSKEEYWDRKEARDIEYHERSIQRDKDMAWSGLAQAGLDSVGLVQLNTENTLEGFITLVVKATNLLLQARDKRNS